MEARTSSGAFASSSSHPKDGFAHPSSSQRLSPSPGVVARCSTSEHFSRRQRKGSAAHDRSGRWRGALDGWGAGPPFLRVMFLLFFSLVAAKEARLGVNLGTDFMSVPLPVSTLKALVLDNGFDKVKFFHSRPATILEFANTGLKVMVAVTNGELPKVAKNISAARDWVTSNLVPLIAGGVDVGWVAVGNEPFSPMYKGAYTNLTVPALANILRAVKEAQLSKRVLVTFPTDTSIFQPGEESAAVSEPRCHLRLPSGWQINPAVAPHMKNILQMLQTQDAPLLLNTYSYLDKLHYPDPGCPYNLDYALLRETSPPVTDPATGLSYFSLFDVIYDAVLVSMQRLGFTNTSIVITEAGWPTDGQMHANATTAQEYMTNFARHTLSGQGTPMRPGLVIDSFIFELVDENLKPTFEGMGGYERHWGIYTAQGQPKYAVDLLGLGLSNPPPELAAAVGVQLAQPKWCVAVPKAEAYVLKQGLYFACHEGRADCSPLYTNASCGMPNTTLDHASFAFNSYFQDNGQEDHACSFENSAKIVTEDPSHGKCKFYIGLEDFASPPPAATLVPPPPPAAGIRLDGSAANLLPERNGSPRRWHVDRTISIVWAFALYRALGESFGQRYMV